MPPTKEDPTFTPEGKKKRFLIFAALDRQSLERYINLPELGDYDLHKVFTNLATNQLCVVMIYNPKLDQIVEQVKSK